MINEASIHAVERAGIGEGFVRPLYDSYSFSRIPATIFDLFSGHSSKDALPRDTIVSGAFDTVVLILLDGFGWRFFERYVDDFPFLQAFVNDGIVSKITSQFPSTTAAHVTCIHTGQNVGASGVYEWFYYEPSLDRMISPLLGSFAGDKEIDTLKKAGIDTASLYPQHTIYESLRQSGVSSFFIQRENIAHSSYSQAMSKGAAVVPYSTLQNGLDKIHELAKGDEKRYLFFYISDIDDKGHRFGIASSEFEQTAKQILHELESLLAIPNAALVMIADHGMIEVHPKETYYLNEKLPSLLPLLKRNAQGQILAPAGSCRDFFLHVQDQHLRKAEAILQEALGDKAWVVKTQELIDKKFFGENPPTSRFLSRVGTLVILPKGEESVWWYEKGRFEQNSYGMHGGLSRAEMESIFLFRG
jgi:predicted AlkP superfamily pyrophosphatase or phosphodiesterase